MRKNAQILNHIWRYPGQNDDGPYHLKKSLSYYEKGRIKSYCPRCQTCNSLRHFQRGNSNFFTANITRMTAFPGFWTVWEGFFKVRGFAPDYLMRQKQQKPKSYHIPRRNTSRIPAYPSFSTVWEGFFKVRGFAPDYLKRQKQPKLQSYHIPRANKGRCDIETRHTAPQKLDVL